VLALVFPHCSLARNSTIIVDGASFQEKAAMLPELSGMERTGIELVTSGSQSPVGVEGFGGGGSGLPI
jgi:hypothetical protein